MYIDDVIEAYQSTVYGIALTRTRNKEDADDVFQEVFLAYFRRNPAFREEEHRKAWLINTALNCAKKCLRQRTRAGVPMEELPEEVFAFEAPEDTALFDALCALAEDGNGVNLFAMASVCWRGLQELLARVDALEKALLRCFKQCP